MSTETRCIHCRRDIADGERFCPACAERFKGWTYLTAHGPDWTHGEWVARGWTSGEWVSEPPLCNSFTRWQKLKYWLHIRHWVRDFADAASYESHIR